MPDVRCPDCGRYFNGRIRCAFCGAENPTLKAPLQNTATTEIEKIQPQRIVDKTTKLLIWFIVVGTATPVVLFAALVLSYHLHRAIDPKWAAEHDKWVAADNRRYAEMKKKEGEKAEQANQCQRNSCSRGRAPRYVRRKNIGRM